MSGAADAVDKTAVKIHNERVKLVANHYDRLASNIQTAGLIAPLAAYFYTDAGANLPLDRALVTVVA